MNRGLLNQLILNEVQNLRRTAVKKSVCDRSKNKVRETDIIFYPPQLLNKTIVINEIRNENDVEGEPQ